MESSACKIVGHVEYNGEALVQLGFKCLPRRTHPSGTPNSGSQLFLAISLSHCSRRASSLSILSLCRRYIITRGLQSSVSLSGHRLFSLPAQLDLKLFVFRCSLLSPLTISFFLRVVLSFTYDLPPSQPPSRALWSGLRPSLLFSLLFLLFSPAVGPLLGPPPPPLSLSLCTQRCRDYFMSFRDVGACLFEDKKRDFIEAKPFFLYVLL